MSNSIQVFMPATRLLLGRLQVVDSAGSIVYGPVFAYGKSDNQKAIAEGNPTRDPTKKYGDTPLGEYTGTVSSVINTPENQYAYGLPNSAGVIPIIWLTPQPSTPPSEVNKRQQSEDEEAGHPVNMGLAIHTGPLNKLGQLRPTYGCIRIGQVDMNEVLKLVEGTFKVSVEFRSIMPTPQTVTFVA